MDSSKTIVLITGSNAGIGYETAKNLLLGSAHWHILIGSRSHEKGENALKELQALPIKGTAEVLQIDVASDSSVDAAADHVETTHGRLDVLVNNAGILDHDPIARNSLRKILDVNLIGSLSVTEAFLPLLKKSTAKNARLIFVSSSTGSITHLSDPTHALHQARGKEYRCSKAALNMLMVQYWIGLKDEGFLVHGADPGLVATSFAGAGNDDMLRARGAAEPEVGGERIARVIRGDADADVGKVCGEYFGEYKVCPW